MKRLTGITGVLTCAAFLASLGILRFSRSVMLRLLGDSGGDPSALPRPTVLAIRFTEQFYLLSFLVFGVAVLLLGGIAVKNPQTRLLIQVFLLLFTVTILCAATMGFFMPFYIPEVTIP